MDPLAKVAAESSEVEVSGPAKVAPSGEAEPAKVIAASEAGAAGGNGGVDGGLLGPARSFWRSILSPTDEVRVPVTAADHAKAGPLAPVAAALDNYFKITHRGSTFYYEFTGGMTTFFAMCYILALNGVILSGTGISRNGSFFATALASGIFTTMMGLLVNVPVALAPGMGLNGYFAALVASGQMSFKDALGAVFISGIFYLVLTVTGLRAMVFRAVPPSMRAGITVGIGFFIAMIGLKIGQITRITVNIPAIVIAPDAFTNLGNLPFWSYDNGIVNFAHNGVARMAALGLCFVAAFRTLNVPGAVILAIILTTFIGINHGTGISAIGDSFTQDAFGNTLAVTDLTSWKAGCPGSPAKHCPQWLPIMDDIPSGKLSFGVANTGIFWEAVFTFLFVELFDSFGTLVGTMTRAKLLQDDGTEAEQKRGMELVNRAMLVDGFGLVIGSIIGSNSITCYIESNTGIEAGARTGFASFITGLCFLFSLLFVAPFVLIIPDAATTCALVFVGVCSLEGVRRINFDDFVDVWCAFIMFAIMGFTYSIANGISFGFISYSGLQIVRHFYQRLVVWLKRPDLALKEGTNTALPHPLMVIMAIFMVGRFRWLVSI